MAGKAIACTSIHNVFDVVEDAEEQRSGRLLFGNGLAVYEPTTGHVELLSDERNVPGSLPEKFERRLFLGHSGLLWIDTGINSGFATTDPLGAKFHLIIDSNPNLKNPGNYVSALDEDAQGRLWLALAGADLTRYNRAEGHLPASPTRCSRRSTAARAGYRPASRHVAQCRQRYMVGRNGQGRRSVRPQEQRQAPRDSFAAFGLDSPGARNTQGARRQPVARLAGRRACTWPPGKRRVRGLFKHREAQADSLTDDYVVSLYEDRSGRIWIGTTGGLTIYDAQTRKFRTVRHDAADTGSISDDIVHTVRECGDGTIWVGTHSELEIRRSRPAPTAIMRFTLPHARRAAQRDDLFDRR